MVEHEPTALLESDWEPTAAAGVFGSADALASFQLLIADYLSVVEDDEDRREKMRRNVDTDWKQLHRVDGSDVDPRQVIHDWANTAEREERIGLLVEVLYLNPFAPNEIKHKKRDRRQALAILDKMFEFDPGFERIDEVSREATRSHRNTNWGKVGLVGVGAAALLAAGGFVAAPLIGAGLGAAAGLSGAAAAAHGLALLGGGALAAGGAGVAGGMWLIAGAGAAVGAVAGGGGTALYQLGAANATRELIKLQITFKLAILSGQADMIKAQEVVVDLNEQLEDARSVLEEALLLNDSNAQRVKNLEATITALENAIEWMEDEESQVA